MDIIARAMANSIGKTPNSQTWTATANQTVFTITNGTYVPNKNLIEVVIDSVPQFSGVHFTETNSTSFTVSEPLIAGQTVRAKWNETKVPSTIGHSSTHAKGGNDEIDITLLKNYQENVANPLADMTNNLSGVVNLDQYSSLVTNLGQANEDWTNALQTALNTNKRVRLGMRNYNFSGSITLNNYNIIEGCGRIHSTLTYTGSGSAILFGNYGCIIKDFLLTTTTTPITATLIGLDCMNNNGVRPGLSRFQISNIDITYFYYGIYFIQPYVGQIDNSTVMSCTTGIKINNDTQGVATSTTLTAVYANNCTTGYDFTNVVYSSMISCACDGATTSYQFNKCRMNILGCGTEKSFTAIQVNGYQSNITFTSFYAYQGGNSNGLVQTNTTVRNFDDRLKLTFDDCYFHSALGTQLTQFINYTGDAKIIVRNCNFDPYTGYVPPISLSRGTIYTDYERSPSDTLPITGVYRTGEIIYKANPVSGASYGWVNTRWGGAYKEDYNSANAYAVGDQVRVVNAVYICLQANNSSSPQDPTTQTTYWRQITASNVLWKALPNLA